MMAHDLFCNHLAFKYFAESIVTSVVLLVKGPGHVIYRLKPFLFLGIFLVQQHDLLRQTCNPLSNGLLQTLP